GDQRRGDAHDLHRRHVHVLHPLTRQHRELVLVTARHEPVDELALLVQVRVRLCDDVLAFLDRGQVLDLVRDASVHDLPIRGLEEAVLVRARVDRERVDQADVRTFGGLDRANAAVVRRVHVADLEARALARQPARSERGHAALVRDLGQRVVLIHELRELARAEELLHSGRDRLRVDHLLRHQAFGLGERQPLLHGALDAHEADAERVLRHLADAAYAAIAEMVDVVDLAVAVADIDQRLQDVDDVLLRQRARPGDLLAADATIELHAADGREVVTLDVEEQVLEQVLGRLLRRGLAGPHHAIDLDERLELRRRRIDAQRVRDVRAAVEIVHVQRVDLLDAGLDQLLHRVDGELVVRLREQLAGRLVDDAVREDLALEVLDRHLELLDAGRLDLTHVTQRDAAVLLDHDLLADLDVEAGRLAAQALGDQLQLDTLRRQRELVLLEEQIE